MKHSQLNKKLAICGAAMGAMLGFSSGTYAETLDFTMSGDSGVALFGESGLDGAFSTNWDFSITDMEHHVGIETRPFNFSLQLPFELTLSDIRNFNVQLMDDGGNVVASGRTIMDTLSPGDYSLMVSGNGSGLIGGVYQGVAWVHPVPEVPTWAMMAVGLGLVGLALRRKPRTEQDGVPVTGAAA